MLQCGLGKLYLIFGHTPLIEGKGQGREGLSSPASYYLTYPECGAHCVAHRAGG